MKLLKKYLVIGVGVVAYYSICNIFNITCPIKHMTGVPCPTCGMTRAMLALMRLDIKGYIEYNPMAFFMFFGGIFAMKTKKRLKKNLETSINKPAVPLKLRKNRHFRLQ